MESHGTRDTDAVRSGDFSGVVPCDRPEWMDCMLDRVNSMYQRDKNHPAILIWSCGNESFGGKVIFEMSQLYRKMDPTRLVHYEGVNDDRRYNDTSDMESRMYTTVNEIREFLSKDRRKPYVCCEYAHAMGNSCGAMKKYMDLPRKNRCSRAALSGIISTSQSTKKTATEKSSRRTAETLMIIHAITISAEMVLYTAASAMLPRRCRK